MINKIEISPLNGCICGSNAFIYLKKPTKPFTLRTFCFFEPFHFPSYVFESNFFQKIFGAKIFFYTSSNVGFLSSELSKGMARKEKMCAEQTMLFTRVHAVPQGLRRGPESQYVEGGMNVPCHARTRTEQG